MLNLEEFKAFYKLPTAYHVNVLSALHLLFDPKVPEKQPIPSDYFKKFKEKRRMLEIINQMENEVKNISRQQFILASDYLQQNQAKKINSKQITKQITSLNDQLQDYVLRNNTSRLSTIEQSREFQSTNEIVSEDQQKSYTVKIIKEEPSKYEVFQEIRQNQTKQIDFFTNLSFQKKLKSKKKKKLSQLTYKKPSAAKNIFKFTSEDYQYQNILPIIQHSEKLTLVDFDVTSDKGKQSEKSRTNSINEGSPTKSIRRISTAQYQYEFPQKSSRHPSMRIDLQSDFQVTDINDSPQMLKHQENKQSTPLTMRDALCQSGIITNTSDSSNDSSEDSEGDENSNQKNFKLVFFDENQQKVTSEKFKPEEFKEAIDYLDNQDFIEKGEVDMKRRLTRVSIRRASLFAQIQNQQADASEEAQRRPSITQDQEVPANRRKSSINKTQVYNSQVSNDQRRRSSLKINSQYSFNEQESQKQNSLNQLPAIKVITEEKEESQDEEIQQSKKRHSISKPNQQQTIQMSNQEIVTKKRSTTQQYNLEVTLKYDSIIEDYQ